MRDLLPAETPTWIKVIQTGRELCRQRGYWEIHTPVLEHTEVFLHGVGEGTDVVDKEMYTFEDKGGRSLTLRPELTASVVRAYFEAGLHQGPQPVRVWYEGPLFRFDRPQRGRYRQFHQFGVEALGDGSPEVDVEVIDLGRDWFRAIEIPDVSLKLNSIGDEVCRPAYRELLRDYYRPHLDELCDDCRRRFEVNPLRLFDCKKASCNPFMADAPAPVDHLCEPCAWHHRRVREGLEALGIEFRDNPRLVRGLDYYTRTAFEFWDPGIEGAQNAYGGGGRYDGLAQVLGFQETPGVGFAMGLDRVVLKLEELGQSAAPERPDVYVIPAAEGSGPSAQLLARDLRRPGRRVVVDYAPRSLKAHMRQAQRLTAPVVVILGEAELNQGQVVVRDMAAAEQETVALEMAPEAVDRLLAATS